MEAVRFDVLYSFKYSVRPGTAAAALEDDITPGEKAERLMALQTLQKKITMENNRNRVGRSYAVLVDGTSLRNPDQVHGRTSHNTIVNFPGERSLVGRIAAHNKTDFMHNVKIKEFLESRVKELQCGLAGSYSEVKKSHLAEKAVFNGAGRANPNHEIAAAA